MSDYEMDLVSVITPAYNAEKYIEETIMSVINQTYDKWEMIVVDDVSSDGTVRVVQEYCARDARIKLIRADSNGGPASARNIGLASAKGRYVAFLDSDDLMLPQRLELQLQFMNRKGTAFSFTSYRRMSESGDSTGVIVNAVEKVSYKDLLRKRIICGCTVLVDRSLTGPIEYENDRNEDFLLWLKLLKAGHTAHGLAADLARYRKPRMSRSSNKVTAAYGIWKLYREHEAINFLEALIYFVSYAVTSTIKNYVSDPYRNAAKR